MRRSMLNCAFTGNFRYPSADAADIHPPSCCLISAGTSLLRRSSIAPMRKLCVPNWAACCFVKRQHWTSACRTSSLNESTDIADSGDGLGVYVRAPRTRADLRGSHVWGPLAGRAIGCASRAVTRRQRRSPEPRLVSTGDSCGRGTGS